MPSHLVTFCNSGQATFALIGDRGVETTITVDPSILAQPAGGTVGAVFHDERCYVAIQADPAAVAVFARDWTLERIIRPGEVRDIHGLAVLGDDLLVVSTATNQIIACDLASGRVRPFWASGDALCDTLHVNDVAVSDGRVLASDFGRRTAEGPRSGRVFDAVTGESLVRHLREPHSVTVDAEGLIHVLESPTGDLLRCPSGFSPRRVMGITGYARGLAVGVTTIAIGQSGYRQQSRSGLGNSRMAPLAPTAAGLEASAMSGVYRVERAGGALRFVDTSAIGPEVYAVVECPWPDEDAGKARRTARRGGPARRRRG